MVVVVVVVVVIVQGKQNMCLKPGCCCVTPFLQTAFLSPSLATPSLISTQAKAYRDLADNVLARLPEYEDPFPKRDDANKST